MKLNRNGKLARFYLWMDIGTLPDNLCRFFWGLVGRVSLLLFLLFVVAALVFNIIFWGWKLLRFGWAHPWAAIVTFVVAAIMAAYIRNRRSQFVGEIKDVTAAKIDAIKNRYCPQIEWR